MIEEPKNLHTFGWMVNGAFLFLVKLAEGPDVANMMCAEDAYEMADFINDHRRAERGKEARRAASKGRKK